ncbi:MAG: hypothetical protein IT244_11975 [Bacteroidia bacterium]|nr:hypothetical protein [Bacteroidia bacterium]
MKINLCNALISCLTLHVNPITFIPAFMIHGELMGFEFKFSPHKTKIPKDGTTAYPNAGYLQVNRDNWKDFVLGKTPS